MNQIRVAKAIFTAYMLVFLAGCGLLSDLADASNSAHKIVASIDGVVTEFTPTSQYITPNSTCSSAPDACYIALGSAAMPGPRTLLISFGGTKPGTYKCGDSQYTMVTYTDVNNDNFVANTHDNEDATCTINVTEVGGSFTGTFEAKIGDFAITNGVFDVVKQLQ